MSSRPGDLPFFSTLMPMSSSAAVNALVNPGSSGYCCRLRRTFGCLFGALPFLPEWDGAICEGIVFVFLSVFFDQFDGLQCQTWDIVVVVVFYLSNKSTKTQANETLHYTILVN